MYAFGIGNKIIPVGFSYKEKCGFVMYNVYKNALPKY